MNGQPIKILICDDSEEDAEQILRQLRDFGMHVSYQRAHLLVDYLQQLEQFDPDLIFSDYILSDFTGLEAMEVARKKDPNIPFIFVSTVVHDASVVETMEKGATDYVFKDQLTRLRLSVLRALRERQEQRLLDVAHDQIRKSAEYFRSLIENASDLVIVLDQEGLIQYAGPSVKRILGYTPEELQSKKIIDFVHKIDRENVGFIYSGKPKEPDVFVEFRFLRKDGHWRNLEALWKTITEGKGSMRAIVNAWDVTDRIKEQEALRESIIRHLKTQTQLQNAQQEAIARERLGAIGQMASGIAHDFSNCLMPVLGFCEILITRPENLDDKAKVKKYLQTIYTSASDAMKIISGLREFYRKKDRVETLAVVHLNKIMEDTVTLTQHKWKAQALAIGANIEVRTDLKPVPETMGNESGLRGAFTNIVLNAVDAMPQGGVLTVSSRSEERSIVVEIADTGIGMDEETRQRCFEPFYSTKGKGGTGLGLSMAYGVLRRHEGKIEIQSQLGKGTTFVIRIPIKAIIHPDHKKEFDDEAAPFDRKLSILVVDDEPVVLDVIRQYLTGDGHRVVGAEDGETALQEFKKQRFDIVLTDRAMPRMNGDQLAHRIKELSPATPVIMVTGFGELMKAKKEKPEFVDLILSKPLKLSAMRAAIAKVIKSD